MAVGYRIPLSHVQMELATGLPLSGGLLYVYENGTTTAKSLFSDRAVTVAAANPIVLDSTGDIAARYVTAGDLLTLVLKTSAGAPIWTWNDVEPFGSSGAFQPLDADLTSIAALTTAAAGRQLLTIADPNADKIYFWDDSAGDWAALTLPSALSISTTSLLLDEPWMIALSDETTAITTGTNKATMVFPYNVTVVSVGASVNTASSSGTPTVDINESGTTILSTKITIDANEKTSLTAAAAPVISDSSITAGNEIGFDIDVAGTGAKGLKVWMIVRRTS